MKNNYRTVGRLIARNKIAGIFLPFKSGLPQGIYEIQEILGEYRLRFVGKPALNNQRLNALDLEGVFAEKEMAAMTQKEINQILQRKL